MHFTIPYLLELFKSGAVVPLKCGSSTYLIRLSNITLCELIGFDSDPSAELDIQQIFIYFQGTYLKYEYSTPGYDDAVLIARAFEQTVL